MKICPVKSKVMTMGNFDIFDGFQFQLKFNLSKILKHYSVYRCMVNDSDHLSKYLKSEYPSKFSPIKFLHYTVACINIIKIIPHDQGLSEMSHDACASSR